MPPVGAGRREGLTFLLKFLFVPLKLLSTSFSYFYFLKKFLNYLFLFSPHPCSHLLPFRHYPYLLSSQQCPSDRLLSSITPFLQAHLLSDTASFPLPGTAPLSSISFPFSITLPPLSDTYSLSAPLPGFPAPVLSDLQRLLPSGTTRSNRTERRASIRSYLAELRAFVRPCLAERRAMAEQRASVQPYGGPPFGQTGPNKGLSFSPIWPNGAGRKGGIGGGEDRCRKAKKGHRKKAGAEKWSKGSGKGEGDERERGGAEEGEGGGAEEEMFRGGRAGVW